MGIIISLDGQEILVDDCDFSELSKYDWSVNTGGYASRKIGKKEILMHREILKLSSNKITDHINLNKLDNRRENIRVCTKLENNKNNRKRTDKKYSSKYKGVFLQSNSYTKSNGEINNYVKWRALIVNDKKKIHLGYFNSEIEAAKAYNEAAIKYHGEFACLNEIEEQNG